MKSLAAIEHVKVVRVHTRVPVADPSRITPDLVRAMKVKGKPTYVAVHVNHPRELSADARAACARLADAGFPLISQTVLLAGVNDKPEVMGELMRALVECRIKPYFLHHGDLAPGTAYLRTNCYWAGADALSSRTFLRPVPANLCVDIPGGHGKSPIGPNYFERSESDRGAFCRRISRGTGIIIRRQRPMADRQRSRKAAATARLAKPINTTAITACQTNVASRRSAGTTFLPVIIA